MKLASHELQSRLAAEYVLGSMRGGSRRRFADYLRMPQHQALRELVAQWEANLTPLAALLPAVEPPPRVWNRIEAAITGSKTLASTGISNRNASETTASKGLSIRLSFWRNLGLGTSALATVLLVTLFAGNAFRAEQAPMMMAVLEEEGVARLVVEQPKSGVVMVKMVKPWKAGMGKSLELWVIPASGAPRSLGVINDTGDTRIAMSDMDTRLTGGLIFALSKEPLGGSPTGQPTGSIFCKGVIAKMPPKKRPQI